jgi:hypothetical protein
VGVILAHPNLCPWWFFDDFLDNQHQAMLILKGNLFDTLAVVPVDHLQKKSLFYSFSLGLC